MTNRNLSQLPLNDTPQETDWLLGASGSSPAVFQKIPVGAVKPTVPTKTSELTNDSGFITLNDIPVSSGGSVNFTKINESSDITQSGYFFTNSLLSDIGINCSSLGLGNHISWINLSTKAVIFYGLLTINGTTIPENKGVKVAAGNSIEFFCLNNNHEIKIISGTYSIDWQAGYTPPYQNYPYSSPGSNGIIYYLGATKYNSSFVNPVTRGDLVASTSSPTYSGQGPEKAFDKSNSYANGTVQMNNSNGNSWFEFYLPNMTMRITSFELWGDTQSGFVSFSPNSKFQAWNNSSWVDLLTFSPSGGASSRWYSGSFSNSNFYSKYRIYMPSSGYWNSIGDLELYGDI